MAYPEPILPLTGQDAINFHTRMEHERTCTGCDEKVMEWDMYTCNEYRALMRERAQRIKQMMENRK